MVDACRCDKPNRACRRAGVPMLGRLWELCSGKCPPNRKCSTEQSESYRAAWDIAKRSIVVRVRWRLSQYIGAIHWRRYLRFLQAVLRHVLAGLPRASAADVAARRAICDPCFWRDRKTDTCTQCGCRLGGKKELVAKLSWAGEKCPLYDTAKRPGQYWGAVKGETVFRRLLRLLS